MKEGIAQAVGRMRAALRWAWWYLRQVSGDAAYENYLRSRARRGPGCAHPPGRRSREEFYLDALRRRYQGPTRCC